MIDGLGLEIDSLSPTAARRAADACSAWGRGQHPAGLNFGDCFPYDLAKRHECPLLCVGKDYTLTDLSTLPGES